MIPPWFHALATTYLIVGAATAILIAVHLSRNPQPMWIMNLVWPVTALFGTIFTAKLYLADRRRGLGGDDDGPPFPLMVAKGTLHCGAGCTLGDIVAEWMAFLAPAVAVAFGWHWLFAHEIFAVWVLDYVLAYLFGVAFQYYTIKPMRDLSPSEGLIAAIKADSLSLTAWQVGMYGLFALAKFGLFERVFHAPLETDTVEFWFVMQVAMLCGFTTSFPVNVWLLSIGWKEKM